MKKTFNIIVVMAAALTGCFREPEPVVPGTPSLSAVQITVTVPGAAVPSTRSIAGAGGEAVVDALDVLVFEDGASATDPQVLAERVSGTIVSRSASENDGYKVTFTAALTPNPDATRLVVVANTAVPSTVAVGDDKRQVLSKLSVFDTDGWNANPDNASAPEAGEDYDPIPMYGEKSVSGIAGQEGLTITGIELTRMLARVDVVKNAAVTNFTITAVRLHGITGGYVAPPWNTTTGQLLAQPAAPMALTPPAARSVVACEPEEDADLVGEIYAFESAAVTGAGTGTFLTVEGVYEDETYFYRVDFTDPTGDPAPQEVSYMPLYRNHLYRVEITQVDGRGYATLDEAVASQTILSNLKTSLLVVDESGVNDIVFNGQYWLGVDRSLFVFRADGGEQPIEIHTNYAPGWESESAATWFDVAPAPAAPATRANTETEATITADPWDGSVLRTATFELTAGRLTKTITVIQLPWAEKITADSPLPLSYVGAFWKAEQTGERLIRVPRPASGFDGAWTATVLEGEDWIALDTEMTTDENVGWLPEAVDGTGDFGNDAGFDAKYAVTDGKTYVAGYLGTPSADTPLLGNDPEQIYFRIGLKSKYVPTAAAPARYGIVLLTHTNNTHQQRIWIRQGEAADYLMRPLDAGHELAAKFVPYNLTDPHRNIATDYNEATELPVHGGEFTDYPSQSGYSFQFSGLRVFAPYGSTISNWGTVGSVWLSEIDETCPEGYRRPINIASEFIPSLLQSGTTSDISNTSWGFYADGFFDRRKIDANKRVATNSSDAAFYGRLFFNPTAGSYASNFMPVTGNRTDVGGLSNPDVGLYWTSDPVTYMTLRSNAVGNNAAAADYALHVRCVKDELPAVPEDMVNTPVAFDTYVGAFWRADQTGERLITIPLTGATAPTEWVVQVFDYGDDFAEGDILFSATPSDDPQIMTDTPADMNAQDAAYPVTAGQTTLHGLVPAGGTLFFRVGLRAPWGDAQTPPRYAVAVISHRRQGIVAWDHQFLHLRQGEAADYLFGPADGRSGAVPFSPYNLTGPTMPGTTLAMEVIPEDASGVFTRYPTQIGAMFHGVSTSRKAFNAFTLTNPLAPDWEAGTTNPWSADPLLHETCPPGYRRPTDGPTNAVGPLMNTPEQLATSEIRQSLFLVLPKGTTSGTAYSVDHVMAWGYYADGFFDRRPPQKSLSGFLNIAANVQNSPSTVSNTDNDIAAAGWVHFNTASGASLFFPAGGARRSSLPNLTNVGAFGYYALTDPLRELHVGNLGTNPSYSYRFDVWDDSGGTTHAAPVRCVKE